MKKFSTGQFTPKNPEKYLGKKLPHWRSSWEKQFMLFCDTTPSVLHWASESIQIPYRNPFTNKQTVYIPDFFIVYEDRNKQKHAELIEIKPSSQTLMEKAKSTYDKAAVILNNHKWAAAKHFCDSRGIRFRIINEQEIFAGISK
ncbi:MAG: hypothetical protein RLZZ196_218 [Bacteroidota bacterium]|jgi:hypothetical protein